MVLALEQVRKGGLPPLCGERGQAPLPDLLGDKVVEAIYD